MKGYITMKYKKTFSFIFYFLIIFIYLFRFDHNQSIYSLIAFVAIFHFSQKKLVKYLNHVESKLFFLFSLFFYQTMLPINLSESIGSLQLLILSRKIISFCILLFLVLFIFLLTNQEILNLNYVNPNNFAMSSRKVLKEKKQRYTNLYDNGKETINRKNLTYFVSEIPRHGYIRYTNQYSLPDNFLEKCQTAINSDDNLYIILSNTGSPASQVISLFTHKDFNHLSLSFDRQLETMLSYNGGNHTQNPGLNIEALDSFYQRDGSQALIYSLKATKEQQKVILDNIKRINMEGSAYNVLGLLTNHSIRPNMMFCSQFVYSVLQEADLDFFDAAHTQIKPTDFIEKDVHQRLTFEYKIEFSNNSHSAINSR